MIGCIIKECGGGDNKAGMEGRSTWAREAAVNPNHRLTCSAELLIPSFIPAAQTVVIRYTDK